MFKLKEAAARRTQLDVELQSVTDRKDLIAELTASLPHRTPDIGELEAQFFNPIFVCDEMMMNSDVHKDFIIPGSATGYFPISTCYTSKKFYFVEKNLGKSSFPIAFESLENDGELPVHLARKSRIRGELFYLRGCQFIHLDNYKINGVQFLRKKVRVHIPYFKIMREHWFNEYGNIQNNWLRTPEHVVSVEAHMYVGVEEYWKDQLFAETGFFDFKPVTVFKEEERVWLREHFDYKSKE